MRRCRSGLWRSAVLALAIAGAPCRTAEGAAYGGSGSWLYRAWQTDDGLPDNGISGVTQTADGYLWIASPGGLLRFNGATFTELPLLQVRGVPIRVTRAMLLDRAGRLWLGMERGPVIALGPDQARTFLPEPALRNTRATAFAEDREGAVWAAYNGGFCRIKDGRCATVGRAGGGTWLAADAAGELWFARGRQLGTTGGGKLTVVRTFDEGPLRMCAATPAGLWVCAGPRLLRILPGREPEPLGQLPDKAQPRALLEDHAGALWIGTAAHGLFRLQDGSLEQVPVSHPEVTCLAEDHEGNLWAGTDGGGLNLVRPRVVSLFGRDAGLPFESVRSVCQDSAGRIWATTQNGLLLRGEDGRWATLGEADGWTAGNATCVASDRRGGVWVGTSLSGVHFHRQGQWKSWSREQGLADNAVRSILVASNDDVWVATDVPPNLQRLRGGQWLVMEKPGESRVIRAMAEGRDGTIWIGTAEGQILRVQGHALVPENAIPQQNPMSVRSLHCTPDGTLWIGYAGYGIGHFKDGHYTRISSAQGLADDYASELLADDHGSMWIAGNRGLFQVGLSELGDIAEGRASRLRSRIFGRGEGLAGLQPNNDYFPAVCRASDGRLWFAMRSGLLAVEPRKIRDRLEPPPVVLERVTVDDQTLATCDADSPLPALGLGSLPSLAAPGVVLRLPPAHRKIEFEFAALSFASPENVHFRYRLANFDEKWIEAGPQRRASYPRLPAGTYRFRVIAANHVGVWNDSGASVALVIEPFLWQTWWFRAAALLAFTASLIALVRYLSFRRLHRRMRQLEQESTLDRERARIARDMHDEVGAKLTRLSLLGEMAGTRADLPPAARAEVAEISATAREAILAFEEIVWAVNPRNDTLEDLIHYLCRHAEDLFEGSATECAFSLPQSIPPVALPTEARHHVFLAAKEALHNVLKHARASRVRINLALGPDAFELAIEDDGCGFDPAATGPRAGTGNGLPNMRERIEGIGGTFDCHSRPGQGTRVAFRVPLPAPTNPAP